MRLPLDGIDDLLGQVKHHRPLQERFPNYIVGDRADGLG